MKKNPLIPIILCGGSGSRLWPSSRRSFPKQFLSITEDNNKTLLQQTQERLTFIKQIYKPIYICNEEHRFIVAEQMREINIIPKSILLEPFGRNTAPAILLAAFKSLETEDNPHLLILSADHQIKNDRTNPSNRVGLKDLLSLDYVKYKYPSSINDYSPAKALREMMKYLVERKNYNLVPKAIKERFSKIYQNTKHQ